MLDYTDITKNAEKNIQKALKDYWAHTEGGLDIYDDISASFIERLAHDSTRSKRELRELFSKSPAWNEELDALVMNTPRGKPRGIPANPVCLNRIMTSVASAVSCTPFPCLDS